MALDMEKSKKEEVKDADLALLTLFRMNHEMKQGLKPEVVASNDENDGGGNYCFDCAYNMAKRAVQRLAFALYNPPQSEDMKESRLLRAAECAKTFSLMLDGNSTVMIEKDSSEETDMSVDDEIEEE